MLNKWVNQMQPVLASLFMKQYLKEVMTIIDHLFFIGSLGKTFPKVPPLYKALSKKATN